VGSQCSIDSEKLWFRNPFPALTLLDWHRQMIWGLPNTPNAAYYLHNNVSSPPVPVDLRLLYVRRLGRKAVDDYTRWTITTLPPVTMELVFIDLRAESLLICSESSANNKPLVVSNS
jgi:hypothetical protein